jgi:MarR family transcriptional regulator, temperature-dependent positive regulator of motility
MTATRRKGTLMLLSRLSKIAMRATPESEMGMTYRHYMTLHSLPEPVPQSELAEQLCIDANNTVILLNELEAKGWVRRERDPADRRRHLVVMTDAGRDAYGRAQLSRDVVEDTVLGPLGADERQQLHDLLVKALGEPS